jgi:hypothetical protein
VKRALAWVSDHEQHYLTEKSHLIVVCQVEVLAAEEVEKDSAFVLPCAICSRRGIDCVCKSGGCAKH